MKKIILLMLFSIFLSGAFFLRSETVVSETPVILGVKADIVRTLKPEVIEHMQQAQQLMAKALYHMAMAEELQPGLSDLLEGNQPVPTRNDLLIDSYTRVTRSGGSEKKAGFFSRANKNVDRDEKGKMEQANREVDKEYDRAKKGFKVLSTGLKILQNIPIIKNFVPKDSDKAVDAAEKTGDKMTGPRDGMKNINGRLMQWDSKTGKWKDAF